jgi:hypothetical protein
MAILSLELSKENNFRKWIDMEKYFSLSELFNEGKSLFGGGSCTG